MEKLREFFGWIWFIICLPYHLVFDKTLLGGAGGLESEFEDYKESDKLK